MVPTVKNVSIHHHVYLATAILWLIVFLYLTTPPKHALMLAILLNFFKEAFATLAILPVSPVIYTPPTAHLVLQLISFTRVNV